MKSYKETVPIVEIPTNSYIKYKASKHESLQLMLNTHMIDNLRIHRLFMHCPITKCFRILKSTCQQDATRLRHFSNKIHSQMLWVISASFRGFVLIGNPTNN